MDFREILKNEYIRQCSGVCNRGGYSKLESEKEKIRERIINKYGFNSNNEEVFRKVMVCEKTVFDFLEELSKQKFRHYMWITDFHEKELTGRLNIALQIV